ncbi:MAG: type II secretion system major pseudopilin GspG [Verrucomicrobiales bacterium]
MKRHSAPKHRRRAGFSLLEMVIVLGIIAVILGGAIAVMGGLLDSAKNDRVYSDFRTIEAGLLKYQISNGRYPTTAQGLQALVEQPSGAPRWSQIMKSVPLDPWQEPYGYKFPGSKDKTTFELISKGPDMTEGTDDDISSQDEE